MTEGNKKRKKIPLPRAPASMFQCRQCGGSFRTVRGLLRHMFKKHPLP